MKVDRFNNVHAIALLSVAIGRWSQARVIQFSTFFGPPEFATRVAGRKYPAFTAIE